MEITVSAGEALHNGDEVVSMDVITEAKIENKMREKIEQCEHPHCNNEVNEVNARYEKFCSFGSGVSGGSSHEGRIKTLRICPNH